MGHYIAFGRESGLTPLISIGTDWHERNPDYNQNTADLPDWIVDALEKKQIIVWYDALKQS